jgi:hypothetical protein
MISPTLLHLLRGPYWWHVVLIVPVAVFTWFTASTTKIGILKVCSAILLFAAVCYFNYIIFGLILSEKLRLKFMRSDADWTGWHSVDIGMGAFIGLVSFFGAIALLVRTVIGIG